MAMHDAYLPIDALGLWSDQSLVGARNRQNKKSLLFGYAAVM